MKEFIILLLKVIPNRHQLSLFPHQHFTTVLLCLIQVQILLFPCSLYTNFLSNQKQSGFAKYTFHRMSQPMALPDSTIYTYLYMYTCFSRGLSLDPFSFQDLIYCNQRQALLMLITDTNGLWKLPNDQSKVPRNILCVLPHLKQSMSHPGKATMQR